MLKPLFITGMAISFALTATVAMAADQRPLEEIGEDLFYNPALGGSINELSCNSCHSWGYRLEYAPGNPNVMFAIRQCLVDRLGGSNKDGLVNMGALGAYVMELSGGLSLPFDTLSPDMMNGFRPNGSESRRHLNEFRKKSRSNRPAQANE
jgi:hypothetical protein